MPFSVKFNGNRKSGTRPYFGRIYPPQGGGARALVDGRALAPNPGEPALKQKNQSFTNTRQHDRQATEAAVEPTRKLRGRAWRSCESHANATPTLCTLHQRPEFCTSAPNSAGTPPELNSRPPRKYGVSPDYVRALTVPLSVQGDEIWREPGSTR